MLEVGSGTGGLTAFLAERAGTVIAVEVDSRMQQLTAEAVDGFSNVTILGCDVLKNKNHFSQPVLDALDAALAEPSKRLKLVANLPYGVATPVISNLVASDYAWERMVVTIQLELAERMAAKEGTSSYGALSVWLAAQCRIEVAQTAAGRCFLAPPKGRVGDDSHRSGRRSAAGDPRPGVFARFFAGRLSTETEAAAKRARCLLSQRSRPAADRRGLAIAGSRRTGAGRRPLARDPRQPFQCDL